MAKLYFRYGAMGSSKTAQALITKFNYEERGMRVWLIKPATDDRDGRTLLRSRIGLEAECTPIPESVNIYEEFMAHHSECDVIIADECQFLTEEHVNELRKLVDVCGVPVLCYGLRTDFRTRMFTGSARLFEVADSISEIKTICECGRKAIVNARIDSLGNVITEGSQIFLGGNDSYIAMCHRCYKKKIKNQENN